MKKGKNKNKNVLSRLNKAVNAKANPIFNKKSQAENYDKEELDKKISKNKLKSKIESTDGMADYLDIANLTNKKFEVVSEQMANQTINSIQIVPINL